MIEYAPLTILIDIINSLKDLGIELGIIGIIFFGIEKIRPAEKKTPFFKSDFKQELGLAALNASIFSPLFYTLIAIGLLELIKEFLPHQIFNDQLAALPITLQILAICFIMDFSTYWRHRFTHRAPFFWRFHSVHHAAKSLNWLTAKRLHPIDLLVATIFDVFLLHILGFEADGIIFGTLAMMLYNYFTHANLDLKFEKPFRYIFASPNFHRWHHATEKSAHNKNFCAMFSLLDLIFGTYHHPEELPEGYGLEPKDQKEYPKELMGWILYPFKKKT